MVVRVEYDRSNRVITRRTGNRPSHAVARGGQFFFRGQAPWPLSWRRRCRHAFLRKRVDYTITYVTCKNNLWDVQVNLGYAQNVPPLALKQARRRVCHCVTAAAMIHGDNPRSRLITDWHFYSLIFTHRVPYCQSRICSQSSSRSWSDVYRSLQFWIRVLKFLLLSFRLHATIISVKFLQVQWLHFTGVVNKCTVAQSLISNIFSILHTKNYQNWFTFDCSQLTDVFRNVHEAFQAETEALTTKTVDICNGYEYVLRVSDMWKYTARGHWVQLPSGCSKSCAEQSTDIGGKRQRGYTTDCCIHTSDIAGRQHLQSAGCHQLFVPRHRRSMFGCRKFSVAGRRPWTGYQIIYIQFAYLRVA